MDVFCFFSHEGPRYGTCTFVFDLNIFAPGRPKTALTRSPESLKTKLEGPKTAKHDSNIWYKCLETRLITYIGNNIRHRALRDDRD